MQNLAPLIAAALLLGACDTGQAPGEPVAAGSGSATPASSIRPLAGKWRLQSGGGGKALVLIAADGKPTLRLYCPAGGGRIEVGVPAFRSIASEERLSFGSGGAVAALVADPRRNTRGGGVSAAGAVPGELSALIAGPLSASYGAQTSGPHPAPPAALASGFMAACGKAMVTAAPSAAVSPCLLQGTERLTVASGPNTASS